MSQLLLVSTLQPGPPAGSRPEGPDVQLDAVQSALRQREHEASGGLRGSARSGLLVGRDPHPVCERLVTAGGLRDFQLQNSDDSSWRALLNILK